MFGIRRGDGRWYAGTVDREAQWVSGWVDVDEAGHKPEGQIATFDTELKAEARLVGLLEAGIECEVVPA